MRLVASSGVNLSTAVDSSDSCSWQDTGYVFTTRTGRPIEPRNL